MYVRLIITIYILLLCYFPHTKLLRVYSFGRTKNFHDLIKTSCQAWTGSDKANALNDLFVNIGTVDIEATICRRPNVKNTFQNNVI